MPGRPKGRPKIARLSRERIIAAALRHCEQGEMDKVTLRSIARQLRVDPMALYHYFPDREALLRAALTEAFAPLAAAAFEAQNWHEAVISMLLYYREVASRYLSLTLYLIARPGDLPPSLEQFNERLKACLAASRRPRETLSLMRDVLIDYCHGFFIAEQHFDRRLRSAAAERFRQGIVMILRAVK